MLCFFNRESFRKVCIFQTRIICLFFISTVYTVAEASREVSGNRECSTCHIMWLKDFNRADVTPLIPYEPRPIVASGKQDVSSTNEMCFSCHDGFVLDSRSVWKNGNHSHPVGVKPSKKIKIPTSEGKTVFPLNDDGKVYCGTCHSAHGVEWKKDDSTVFLRVRNDDSRLCLACHLEKSTGPKEGNHPIFKRPPNKPDSLIQAGAKFAKDGGVICQSCHNPHSSKNKNILIVDNHNSGLCMTCHKDKKMINNTKHNLKITAPKAVNIKGEKVTESGVCAACHQPHNANGPMLWARNKTQTKDLAAERCVSCHRENGLAKDKTIGQHSHPTMVSMNKPGIKNKHGKWQSEHYSVSEKNHVNLPLYNSAGHKTDTGGMVSCGSCHDPHIWSKSDLPSQADNGEFLEGNDKSSFLRISQDKKSALCITCHLKKKSILSSKHNILNNSSISQKDILHGGVCGQCHVPHNAKQEINLWARSSISNIAVIDQMCLSCHQKGQVGEEKVPPKLRHPDHVKVWSNHIRKKHNREDSIPNIPVFDNKGRRAHVGIISCLSCHNPHQWRPGEADYKITKDEEGDAMTSFLRNKNSELIVCANCHGADAIFRYKYFHGETSRKKYPLFQ